MNVANTISQMRKGILEFCVLTLINKEEICASDIIQRLKSSKLIVVEGTLYPLLTRLKNAGLTSYKWVESEQGPPRKYYEITKEGKAFLKELQDTWKQLGQTIKTLEKQ